MFSKCSRSGLALGMALAFLVAFGVSSASANTFTSYTLGTGNSAISGYTGPYATVTVDLNAVGTIATITFTSNTVGGNIYLLGDGSSVGVNVNAASWTISGISGTNAGTGFTPGTWSDAGSGNVSTFGIFNQTITSFDGFSHSSDSITFTLTNTSGSWASAANVLIANAAGNTVEAHIFVTSSPANVSNGAVATGFATNGTTSTPEPSSTVLLSLALIGVGLATRKFVSLRG